MLYVQGVLIALVGVGGVFLGFLIAGRHTNRLPANDPAASISVNFRVMFKGASDTLAPDDGAVVIAWPKDQTPSPVDRLTETNFSPDRGPPTPEELQTLKKLGGAYARSDAKGNATMTLSKSGDYSVCYISRRTRRAAQAAPGPDDVSNLSRYFQQPRNLLGDRKYHLTTEPLDNDQKLVHDFGGAGN